MCETPRNRGGRPRVDSTPVSVVLPADELAAIDAWRERQPEPRPNRPRAIRRLVRKGLAAPD